MLGSTVGEVDKRDSGSVAGQALRSLGAACTEAVGCGEKWPPALEKCGSLVAPGEAFGFCDANICQSGGGQAHDSEWC